MTRRLPRPVVLGVAVTAILAAGPASASATGPATAAPRASTPQRQAAVGAYIVTLKAPPASAARSAPTGRGRFDARSTTARAYAAGQRATQRIVAARHAVQIRQQYSLATNGFSARLTTAQVQALRSDPAVAQVWPVQRHRAAVHRTPDTLGLTGSAGVWSTVSTTGRPLDAGRGVVVGVLDTGVWPENPAFKGTALATAGGGTGTAWSADGGATTHVTRSTGAVFNGACSGATGDHPVEAWAPSLCNQKLVSARAFPTSAPDYVKVPATTTGAPDYWSPRDNDGHGSHTASTAAGLQVTAGMPAGGTTYPDAGGIAPGASLAAYKVCWDFNGMDDDHDGVPDNYCMDDSVVAAVDQAVADGVDVINFSISGASGTVADPVSRAFLRADQAGISVVTAGGNAGPTAGSVNHVAPWVTTVAASAYTSPYAVQGFSGRGPAQLDDGAILKPDVSAPGLDILAATTPPTWSTAPADQTYEFMSGTSMATPHVAGLTALLRARHAGDPRWTTSAVRGALTTTATATSTPSPFAQGAGYVSPATSLDPGLLLDIPAAQMAGYAQGEGIDSGATPVQPRDVNTASIAIPRQGGPVTVHRTFTATRTGTWTPTVSLPGYAVTTTGPLVATAAGQQLTLGVTLRPAGAASGRWAAGTLTLTPTSGPTLRLPVVSRPGLTEPGDMSATGRSGRAAIRVASPVSGRFTPTVGLAETVTTQASVTEGGSVVSPTFAVPSGAVAVRVDLRGPSSDDLDLSLQRLDGTGTWVDVATSMSPSATERVEPVAPVAGTYRWVAEGYAVAGATSTFTVDRSVVVPVAATRWTVNPRTSVLQAGVESTPWLVWNSLEPGRSYLGWVRYPGSPRATALRITT